MLRHECENCHLRFESNEDLSRHQKKFCIDSEYGNVTRLDMKLQSLNKPGDNFNIPELGDIKQYLRGGDDQRSAKIGEGRRVNELLAYQSQSRQQPFAALNNNSQSRSVAVTSGDPLLDQVNTLKRERQAQRQKANDAENDMMTLIRDLEQRKELELRAQIEKEEIMRSIKDMDRGQLTQLEKERKRELEKLAVERENLRQREQYMMDEVKKMEQQLADQEQQFQTLRESHTTATTKQLMGGGPDRDWSMEQEMLRKEQEMARDRGTRVAELKHNRERLERERLRIMDDLDQLKSSAESGVLPPRRNQAAIMAADQALNSNKNYYNGGNYKLEPSLKEKLIGDQNRINNLRQQQKMTLNQFTPEMDDLDVLQRELEARGNFLDEASRMAQMNEGNPRNLATIRQKLETQAAAPSSYNRPLNNNVAHVDMSDFLVEPPPINSFADSQQADPIAMPMTRPSKGQMIGNLQSLKDEYLLKGGEDPVFVQKVAELEDFLKYRKPLQSNTQQAPSQVRLSQPKPIFQQPEPLSPRGGNNQKTQASTQQAPSIPPLFPAPPQPMFMPPPFGGFPSMYPPQPQLPDPAMEQMTTLLKQQEAESQKLKQALANLGGASGGNLTQIDSIIEKTTKELEDLKQKLTQPGNQYANDPTNELFDEDFVFRQNEFRSEDLDPEERALMNLAAQEYDALRILSRLPKNSDIYQYKMQQYRELSTMRSEMEKVLQEQRLEKIRRDFEKQKYEEERRYKHEQWLEEQKRRILEAKIQSAKVQAVGIGGPTMEGGYDNFNQPPIASPNNNGSFPQQQQQQMPLQNDPTQGFILGIDTVYNLPREFRQLRLVYSVCLDKRFLIQPRMIDLKGAEADFDNPSFNKVFYNIQHVLKGVQPHPLANLVIELQMPDPNKVEGFSSMGWTIMNVFDQNTLQLNKGLWKLPIYRPPTVLDMDLKDVSKLNPMLRIVMCIRLAMPNDEVHMRKPLPTTGPQQYDIPDIHQRGQQEDLQQRNNENLQQQQLQRMQTNRQGGQQQQQQQQQQMQLLPKGVLVVINYVKGLKPFSRVKVQGTLYFGTQIVKQDQSQIDCNWATMGLTSNQQLLAPRGARIDIGPGGKLDIMSNNSVPNDEIVLPVNQEVQWLKDFNVLLQQANNNIYLLLQVFTLPPAPPGNQPPPSSNYEHVGYTVCQLNNSDGTLKFGTFEQGLFKLPINLYKQDPSLSVPHATLGFQLFPPRQMPQNILSQSQDQYGNQQQQQQQIQQQQDESPQTRPQSKQFIANFDKQWSRSEDFQNGDGVDIYVDWARLLPDNTMFTKVFVRAIDSDGKYPQPGQRGFASIDFSTNRNHFYGFKFELRGQNLNPTLLLLVSFETFDRSNNKPCYAGHSYFPLFMDKISELPITDSKQAINFTLHKGFYQMPIFGQTPNLNAPGVTYERFISLERIPTASMLIRIMKAPRGSDGKVLGLDNTPPELQEQLQVLVNAPEYKAGIYNTQYYFNTIAETKLFKIRKMRREIPAMQILDRMVTLQKQSVDIPIEDKLNLINRMITIPASSTQMIDMTFFSPYNPDIGFRFGVEALYNNTQSNCIFAVIASLCPDATLYKQGMTEPPSDAVSFANIDWQSTNHTQKFTDGLFMLQNIPDSSPGMSIIFDVKKIASNGKQYENFGFSVIPLFSQLKSFDDSAMENYINSGIFQLPIYSGAVTPDLVAQLRTTRDPLSTVNSAKLKLLDTTLLVKIVDNQRERHFEKDFESIEPETRFIPQQSLSKLQYKALTQAQKNSQKKLQELIPKGQQISQYQKFMEDTLTKQFNL